MLHQLFKIRLKYWDKWKKMCEDKLIRDVTVTQA